MPSKRAHWCGRSTPSMRACCCATTVSWLSRYPNYCDDASLSEQFPSTFCAISGGIMLREGVFSRKILLGVLLCWQCIIIVGVRGFDTLGSECTSKCNHHDESLAFEACLKMCTGRNTASVIHDQVDNIRYPSPPQNVTVETVAVIEGVKFLESTIRWDFEPDDERVGFYLRVTTPDKWCEKEFPGYYAFNIEPMERSHVIPVTTTDGQPLEIQHECVYNIQMHSKPYPYGDEAFVAALSYKVPDCVQGYCSCRIQKAVPEPRRVRVTVFKEGSAIKARVNWTYPPVANHTHQFRFDLSERFHHNQILFKDSDAFKFRISDMAPHVVYARENETSFSTVLPINLRADEDYKVTIFSLNDQLCHSMEITVFFTTSDNPLRINKLSKNGTFRTDSSETALSDYGGQNESIGIIRIATEVPPDGTSSVGAEGIVPVAKQSHYPSVFVIGGALLSVALLSTCLLLVILRKSFCNGDKSEIEKSSIIPWAMAHSSHSMLETNILYRRTTNSIESATIDYEIPFSQIQVGGIIGQGAFGLVCMGTARGVEGYPGQTTVAIKQLKPNADDAERREFIAEIDIMKQVGRHPNIVAMYGCCTDPCHRCMVMEYVPFGDLKHYLQNLRKQLDLAVLNMKCAQTSQDGRGSPLPPSLHSSFVSATEDPSIPAADLYHLDPSELQSFASQVANGMAHIESLGIIHRDLAARNILVARGKQLKISDFGLSRHGVYVKTSKGVIPLRWLSIEAIQHYIYSTKSDVWAYGVVLWEICTLGGFPYPTVSDKDILKYLQQGNRLEKPASCSNDIYDVMMQCWAQSPSDRPSFAYLCEHLADLASQQCPYVEFVSNDCLPPPDGYCVLAEKPATHAYPSALSP